MEENNNTQDQKIDEHKDRLAVKLSISERAWKRKVERFNKMLDEVKEHLIGCRYVEIGDAGLIICIINTSLCGYQTFYGIADRKAMVRDVKAQAKMDAMLKIVDAMYAIEYGRYSRGVRISEDEEIENTFKCEEDDESEF